jgi:ribonuclease inhibitor
LTTATIDLSQCRTAEDAHAAIKEALKLPDHYGGNLDALHDCLTAEVPGPLTVVLAGTTVARRALGETMNAILEVFNEAAQSRKGAFTFRVQD